MPRNRKGKKVDNYAFVYSQSSGVFYYEDHNGNRAQLAVGYSGHGDYRNDPDAEGRAGFGPIPRGVWRLGPPVHHLRLGPVSISLTPIGHNAYYRSGFFIHGDNAKGDQSASTGCIILPRHVREAVAALGYKTLEVIL